MAIKRRRAIQVNKYTEEENNKNNHQIEEETTVDNENENNEVIDIEDIHENKNSDILEMFQPASSKSITRSTLVAGAMSVINSKCGKRITISSEVMNRINEPTKVSISFSNESIAVGENLPNNNNQLLLKSIGKKGVIYSAGIVSEITERYGLDFSDRTSITFSEVEYVKNDGYTIAIINIK